MTFEKLHDEIPGGCDCLTLGKEPHAVHIFYRRGANDPALISDFDSYHEMGKPAPKAGSPCEKHCDHRGVSIYQVVIDLDLRIAQLKAANQIRRDRPKFAYFLKFKPGAGLVWYQGKADNHCELFKADDFKLEMMTFERVIDTSTL